MKRITALAAIICTLVICGCSRSAAPSLFPEPSGHRELSNSGARTGSFRLVFASSTFGEPSAGLVYFNGAFFGTTAFGGDGGGTVYRVTPQGNETLLHSLDGNDGVIPLARLVVLDGILYGTASQGGTLGDGTVFSISPAGTFAVLHEFNGADGRDPMTGLTDVNGTLYGTTSFGGANDDGTVFSIAPSGALSVVYSFGGGPDAAQPRGDLLYANGILYGTSTRGGVNDQGTVYDVTPSGVESVLHSFGSGSDGIGPLGSLIEVGGVFYGTTGAGGLNTCEGFVTCGTVFSMTAGGSEKVLHDFSVRNDGYFPFAALVNLKGTLYGTTEAGGLLGSGFSFGTVYSITPRGVEKVIYSFENSGDGDEVLSPLIPLKGVLYGTAPLCGDLCDGSVFALKP